MGSLQICIKTGIDLVLSSFIKVFVLCPVAPKPGSFSLLVDTNDTTFYIIVDFPNPIFSLFIFKWSSESVILLAIKSPT